MIFLHRSTIRCLRRCLIVSPNYKIPANSFQSLDFRPSHSNDTYLVLDLDSNNNPCYPVPCFPRNPDNRPPLHPVSLPPLGPASPPSALFRVCAVAGLHTRAFLRPTDLPVNTTAPRQSRLLLFHVSQVTSHMSLSPLESALTKNTPLTRLESALPKHRT